MRCQWTPLKRKQQAEQDESSSAVTSPNTPKRQRSPYPTSVSVSKLSMAADSHDDGAPMLLNGSSSEAAAAGSSSGAAPVEILLLPAPMEAAACGSGSGSEEAKVVNVEPADVDAPDGAADVNEEHGNVSSNSSDSINRMWKALEKQQEDESLEIDGSSNAEDDAIKSAKLFIESLEARKVVNKEAALANKKLHLKLKAATDDFLKLNADFQSEKAAKVAAALQAEAMERKLEAANQAMLREQSLASEKRQELALLELEVDAKEKVLKVLQKELLRCKELMLEHPAEIARKNEAIEKETKLREQWEKSCKGGNNFKMYCERLFQDHIRLAKEHSGCLKQLEEMNHEKRLVVDFIKQRSSEQRYEALRDLILLKADKMKNLRPAAADGKWEAAEFCKLWDAYGSDLGFQGLLAEMFVRGDVRFTSGFNPNWIFGDVEFRAEMWYRLMDVGGESEKPVRCLGEVAEDGEVLVGDASFWIERKEKAVAELCSAVKDHVCEEGEMKLRIGKALEDREPVPFDKEYVHGLKSRRGVEC